MSVEKRAVDGLPLIEVCGEVDRGTVDELRASVAARLAAGQRRLLFDFGRCSFIDSAAVGVLLDAIRDVGENGLVGVIAANASIGRVFFLMGLPAMPAFHMFDTLTAAVAYIESLA